MGQLSYCQPWCTVYLGLEVHSGRAEGPGHEVADGTPTYASLSRTDPSHVHVGLH